MASFGYGGLSNRAYLTQVRLTTQHATLSYRLSRSATTSSIATRATVTPDHHDHHHPWPPSPLATSWPPAPPSPPPATIASPCHYHPWLPCPLSPPWPPRPSVPRCSRYCNSWRQVSEKLHFGGLNVGKVAKRKLTPSQRNSKNVLTCTFANVQIASNNKLQYFRHFHLGNTRTWPRGISY